MFYLLLVSFVWAFSFGLIKNRLSGLDASAVGAVRIAFALLIFLPLLKSGAVSARQRVQLIITGAVQFGLMYILYLEAFQYLQAFEIALFTITTPLYLALVDAALERRMERAHLLAAVLSVAGAAVIVWHEAAGLQRLRGIALLQLSNLCFAAGQLAYRRIRRGMTNIPDRTVFGWLFLGGLVATGLPAAVWGAWAGFTPTAGQWIVLAYLGLLASGLCFFWWNRGATRVNAGTLAAMNNAKIPLGVGCSLLFFGEEASWGRLLLGGGLLALAVWIAEKRTGPQRG